MSLACVHQGLEKYPYKSHVYSQRESENTLSGVLQEMDMRMDKLTNPLQQALGDAQSLAVGRDHSMIEPAHLLSAFLNQSGGAITPLLQKRVRI